MAHLDPELLSAYIDRELPAADLAAVERHLAGCDACRAEYEELLGLSTLVRELPVYLPKREIDARAWSRPGSDTLAKVIMFGKPLAVAAVVLLVAFAGLRLLIDNDDSREAGDAEQISFSAVQPTPMGTESGLEASEDQAAEAPAPDRAQERAPGEAPAVAATLPPALGAIPALRAETPAAQVAQTEPPATVAPTVPPPTVTPEPAAGGGGDGWLPQVIVAVVAILLAGAAGWYRLVRSPARRRT